MDINSDYIVQQWEVRISRVPVLLEHAPIFLGKFMDYHLFFDFEALQFVRKEFWIDYQY